MSEEVEVKVWDWDQTTGDDFLGECRLSANDLKEIARGGENGEAGKRWMPLKGVKTGKVRREPLIVK